MRFLLIIVLVAGLAGCATSPGNYPSMPVRQIEHITHNAGSFVVPGRESFMWPINGSVISGFGDKVDKVKNKGIDIKAAEGTLVRAAKSGRVVYCDNNLKGFGKTVILDHGDRLQTIYSFNSEILVNVGDDVAKNDVIARAGRTGRAKESSLHFEVRKDGEPKNPYNYLKS